MKVIVNLPYQDDFNDSMYSTEATFESSTESHVDSLVRMCAEAIKLEGFEPISIYRGMLRYLFDNDVDIEKLSEEI